jgi:hypothetical protein
MQYKMLTNIFFISCLIVFCQWGTGCKKFVDPGPAITQVSAENVYANDATAISVLTGIYTRLAAGSISPNISAGTGSFSLRCGLSADEYALYSSANSTLQGFYKNALVSNINTNIGTDYWNVLYDHIYYANSAIEGLTKSDQLSTSVKNQLLGEAKFIRAFFYFYLVNLYGDVPLVTTVNYKINNTLARAPKADVYNQIISDLKEATTLLGSDYLDAKFVKYSSGSEERVRPTKWAATALLARAYLYNGNYSEAESQSTLVINNSALYDTVSLNNVFLKNSREAIWQLKPVKANQNTDDSKMFIITTGFNSSVPVRLSDTLLNSFEVGDKRKAIGNWINTKTLSGVTYYFPYKYKNNTSSVTEYLMVLRLAEQYLIRAEARAQLNKFAEAQSDLNVIRKRAGLPNTTASTQTALVSAILHERQVEFFAEWGHRWFDLKRTNTADPLMSIITPSKKGGTWETTDKLYPIPFQDIQRDPNITQNPGY